MARKLSPPPLSYILEKKFVGYGHYELTVSNKSEKYAIVTGNIDLVQRLNSEDEKERGEATTEAIAFVLEHHNN